MGKRESGPAILERPINRTMVGRDAPDEPRPEPTAESPPDPVTAELVDQQARIELAVEALFGRLARDEPLTANERLFLKQHAPPHTTESIHKFESWLTGCTQRVKSVLDLQAAAGSVADRQAAAAAAEAARQRQADEAPALQEQIVKAQAELQALADATAAAERDVARREQAVLDLQKDTLQPPRIKEQITVVYRVNEIDKRKFLDAESRLRSITGLLRLDPANKDQLAQIDAYCHGLNMFDGGRLSDKVFPREGYKVGDPNLPIRFAVEEWQAHLDVLRAEAEQHRQTIADLEPVNRRVAEEVRQLKMFLVPK